jgi:hypothetical protein
MMERNEYLESDGLVFETDVCEWFADKTSSGYANRANVHGISLPQHKCYVTRHKNTGEYNRVIIDHSTQEVIFESKNLEEIGVHIDILKLKKLYG